MTIPLWSFSGARACGALALAGVSMAYFAGQDMWVAYSERHPTQIAVKDWNTTYHDEHWLSVKGKIVPKDIIYQRQNDGQTFCYVPVVAEDAMPGEHIHVVARVSGKTREEVDNAVLAIARSRAPIDGVISTHGDSNLPIDHLAADMVVLKQGAIPGTASDYGFLAFIGAGMSLFFGYFALRGFFLMIHKAHMHRIERTHVVTARAVPPSNSRPIF